MATTTPNFGWTVPTSTDLVKDGATAIETLGDGIDASFVDLKGGTTGQVLSKASNTDLDFTWVTDAAGDITGVTAGTGISGGGTSGTVTVTNSMATAITTAGDTLYGTGAGTFSRLGIGSTGNVLTVTGGVPTWAAPASGTKIGQIVGATTGTRTATSSTSYVDVTSLTATITPTSASIKILVLVTAPFYRYRSSGDSAAGSLQLVRGSTSIWDDYEAHYFSAGGISSAYTQSVYSLNYLDSPATTSATTYKIQIKARSGTTGVIVNENTGQVSSLILCEVIA